MYKQLFIALCLCTAIAASVHAQIEGPATLLGKSKTEALFDFNNGSQLRHRFIYQLSNGNSITIRVSKKEQLLKLLSFDSIVLAAVQSLQPLADSFQNPLNNRRVDILVYPDGQQKIRHKEYVPKGNTYVLRNNEMNALKVEQDTLILAIYDRPNSMTNKKEAFFTSFYSQVTILINNITDLEKLANGTLNAYLQQTFTQWNGLKDWTPANNWRSNLYSLYDVANPDSKFNTPLTTAGFKKKKSFAPYVQVGIQNINNLLTTSAGAGFVLTRYHNASRTNKSHFQLFWEPYFFFDRNSEGGFRLRRNDFVTFQYNTRQSNTWANGNKVEFSQNISVGYLVRRSGNYFYQNTVKFGLPGAHFKALILHPEFIFNDFFKHFQPGLKLVLDLD